MEYELRVPRACGTANSALHSNIIADALSGVRRRWPKAWKVAWPRSKQRERRELVRTLSIAFPGAAAQDFGEGPAEYA